MDHGTTNLEAKGREGGKYGVGGDILARWGNPIDGTRRLFHQHHPNWIPEGCSGTGNLILFNNGLKKDREYSEVLEVKFDDHSRQFEVVWDFHASPRSKLYSEKYVSSAQRLPNGNTLICSGCEGVTIEVDQDGREAWRFQHPRQEHPIPPDKLTMFWGRQPMNLAECWQ